VEVARDWLDYVAAFGAVAAAIVAVVAVLLAAVWMRRIAQSARAAEWRAYAAGVEAEQTRALVAELEQRLRETPSDGDGPAPEEITQLAGNLDMALELHGKSFITKATIANVGTKSADNVIVSFFAPHTVPFQDFDLDRRLGNGRRLGQEAAGVELVSADGPAVPALRHTYSIDTLEPGQEHHWYAHLSVEDEGAFHLELRAGHPSAAPLRQRYALQVTGNGGAAIEPIVV